MTRLEQLQSIIGSELDLIPTKEDGQDPFAPAA